MILPIDMQIYYFLSTVAAGMIIGIMFDSYRIIRGFNCPNNYITAFSDLLFWILAAIVIFLFFLFTNNGDLRYYTFVGLLLGLIIYFKLISGVFIKILKRIIYYLLKSFRIIIILIIYPIKLIGYLSKYIVYKSKEIVKTGIKGSKNVFKNVNKKSKGKKEKKG